MRLELWQCFFDSLLFIHLVLPQSKCLANVSKYLKPIFNKQHLHFNYSFDVIHRDFRQKRCLQVDSELWALMDRSGEGETNRSITLCWPSEINRSSSYTGSSLNTLHWSSTLIGGYILTERTVQIGKISHTHTHKKRTHIGPPT